MALLGLGIGLIVSSLTTKYKDFKQFIGFGIQLLMFMSPVIVPMSIVNEKFPDWSKPILEYNPMTPIIEGFRAAFFENYVFDFSDLIYSGSVAIVLFVFGFYIFGKTEQNFMDTV
jgi:lipopolysaccharide transport system permease protein